MLTVVVCEDHPVIRKVLGRALEAAGHRALMAHDGKEAVSQVAATEVVDVIVMDLGLPDADGRDVIQALRSAGQQAPVLVLTAMDDMTHVLSGFAVGADDYVTKPFDVREVVARIEALARRRERPVAQGRVLDLDPASHTLSGPAGTVHLTPTEFRMLAAIASRPGEVVRRRAVVAAAWAEGSMVSENTVDSFLRRIRAKLAEVGSPARIETSRGLGFRLSGPGSSDAGSA